MTFSIISISWKWQLAYRLAQAVISLFRTYFIEIVQKPSYYLLKYWTSKKSLTTLDIQLKPILITYFLLVHRKRNYHFVHCLCLWIYREIEEQHNRNLLTTFHRWKFVWRWRWHYIYWLIIGLFIVSASAAFRLAIYWCQEVEFLVNFDILHISLWVKKDSFACR